MKKIGTLLTFALLFSIGLGFGQLVTPTFDGHVQNQLGSDVQNAWVGIVIYQNNSFYTSASTTTDASGNYTYTFPAMPAYQYTYDVIVMDVNCMDSTFLYGVIPGNSGPQTFTHNVTSSCGNVCPVNWYFTQVPGTSQYTYGHTGTNSNNVTWAFYDPNTNQTTFINNNSGTYTCNSSGSYQVCFQIDNCPQQCSTIVVTNQGPCNFAAGGYDMGGGNFSFYHQYGNNFSSIAWDFGDGSTSTQNFPTHQYTAPGTYTVCVVIDNCPPVCFNVTVPIGCNSGGTICGVITAGNNIGTPATVYLIDLNGQNLTAVQTSGTNPNGAYCFSGVPSGTYLLKAALTPNSPDYSNYLPTYYDGHLFWYDVVNDSDFIYVNCDTHLVNFGLIAGVNPGGPGFIGGSVLSGANLIDNGGQGDEGETGNEYGTEAFGDPVPDVSILLLDGNGNPVTHTATDANGDFNFTNLALGSYEVHPEVAGLTTYPQYVTLTSLDPGYLGNQFYLNSTYIAGTEDESTAFEALRVFPNPATDVVWVNFSSQQHIELNLDVLDMRGAVIRTQQFQSDAGAHTYLVTVSDLASGIYLLKLTDKISGESTTVRLVK